VLGGGIPTASGFGRLRAPAASRGVEVLARVLSSAQDTVVHCCAPGVPVALLRKAGAGAVSLDATLLTPHDDDQLGEAVEDGARLLLGVLPTTGARASDLAARMAPVKELWRRLGQAPERLPSTVAVTPTCGLAGSTPAQARSALEASVEVARRLQEEAHG
jgi:hypothetical protein